MNRSATRLNADLDNAAFAALNNVLRKEHQRYAEQWMGEAGESWKRGMITLNRLAESKVNRAGQVSTAMFNWSTMKIPSDLDRACYAALHHVLRPDLHNTIDEWMKTAGEPAKRGIIRLKQMAEPRLLRTIGRPNPGGHQPASSLHSWYHQKTMRNTAQHPSGWPIRDHDQNGFGMGRSSSMPSMAGMGTGMGMGQDVPLYSWQRDDIAETAQIDKPGGYVVQLKDSVEIQMKKNKRRNTGTYQLFGGNFDGTTTQASFHNLRAIGYEPAHL